MDDIKQSGKQSKHLNTIKDAINRGEIITHILNWKVSNEPNNEIGNTIRKVFYDDVNNENNIFIVENNPGIRIMWNMPNTQSSSAYYYTNSIYNDHITAAHAKLMLRGFINKIKNHVNYFNLREKDGYNNNWGISYLVTRPLNYGMDQVAAGDIN